MPAIVPRQSRSSSNSGLTPLRIAGIVLVIVLACFFLGLFVWRRRKLKKREAESSRRARRFIKTAFARSAPPPPLPPYEPRRDTHELQTNPTGGEGAASLTVPPLARLNTPPGYGAHVMDRPAGPISDSPPAYQEHDQRTWGRSGCSR